MDSPASWTPERLAALCPQRELPHIDRLWISGDPRALARPAIGIVGTRAASAYGVSVARRFACELARHGCCIISGLALGIDTAAHEGALAGAGPTIGVLGGGHRAFFPRRNRALAESMIAGGGAVISPFAPDAAAHRGQFLQRNGVIAALCDAIVVIEAPQRSGALNTAGWAAGRIPVFAVPGDIDRAHVAGCHALIRDGAILARSAHDVLSDLRLLGANTEAQRPSVAGEDAVTGLEQRVLAALSEGELDIDSLALRLGVQAPGLLSALSQLELRGMIECRGGQRYAPAVNQLEPIAAARH